MGLPLSSFLAEAVMQDLDSKTVTKNKNILQMINKTTKNIKFTKKEEHVRKLAFLDVLITKTDNGILNTQAYHKKTHTDIIIKL